MSSVIDPSPGAKADLEGVAEESLRFFYESSPLLMGTVALCPDGDLLHLYDNPATSRFFGGQPGATHGKSARSLGVAEEVIAKWRTHYEAAGRQGGSVSFEYVHPHADGPRCLSVTVTPLGIDSPLGYPQYSYVAQDVTEARAAETARQEAQERLALATRASGLGVWEWRLDSGQIIYSPRAREIYGFPPDQPLTYDLLASYTCPEDMPRVVELTGRARDPSLRENPVIEYRINHPEAGVRWLRAVGETIFEDGPEGPVATRYIGMIEDITERQHLEARLQASEARLKLALNAGRMAVFDWPLSEAQPPLTPELRAQLGIAEDAVSSVQERRGNYHPDDLALASGTRDRALSGEARFIDFEFRYFRPDGAMRWLQVRSEVIRDDDGAPVRLVGVQSDITERKLDEERLQLLTREVDHRANNLLAVVQGVVALSRAGGEGELREVLLGRISALGRAQQLLSESRWTGADLQRLLEEELRPFGLASPGRFTLEGPDRALSPSQALAMAMALHELATNAVKHGALSRTEGAVEVNWRIEKGALKLRWSERGGPGVTAPTRTGLGMSLLARAMSGSLGGRTEMDWRPSGLRCRLTLPLSAPQV